MQQNTRLHLGLAAAITICLSPTAFAEDAFIDALTSGKVNLDIQYRFEHVDQDGFSNNAKASTVRTRIGYLTGAYYGFKAFLEFENTTEVGADDYNSPGPESPNKSNHPIVADPTFTEVNQAYLQYSAPLDTTVRFGRQRIKLDNDRFIGNVGFRQNEQTYDALSIQNTNIDDVTIFYSYLTNVNGVVTLTRTLNFI